MPLLLVIVLITVVLTSSYDLEDYGEPEELVEISEALDLRLLQTSFALHRRSQHSSESNGGQSDVPENDLQADEVDLPLQLRYQRNPADTQTGNSATDLRLQSGSIPNEAPTGNHAQIEHLMKLLRPRLFNNSASESIPAHPAQGISFADEDPVKGEVKGMVAITPAVDEKDISHYNLYWASNNTAKQLIASLPAGSYNWQLDDPLNHERGVKIPDGMNQLMVITSNVHGSMHQGVSVDIFDYWEPSVDHLLHGLFRGG